MGVPGCFEAGYGGEEGRDWVASARLRASVELFQACGWWAKVLFRETVQVRCLWSQSKR